MNKLRFIQTIGSQLTLICQRSLIIGTWQPAFTHQYNPVVIFQLSSALLAISVSSISI